MSRAPQAAGDDLLAKLEKDFCEIHAVDRPTDADLMMLRAVVHAQAELETLRRVIDADGATVTGSRGQIRPHPLLSLARALRADVMNGLERLWLTPHHRAAARRVADANSLTRR
jgi:hypothetical protein